MRILVVTCGNTSIKYDFVDTSTQQFLARGSCERIGIDGLINHKALGKVTTVNCHLRNFEDAFYHISKALSNRTYGVIKDVSEIDVVVHKILYGGEKYKDITIVSDKMIEYLKDFCSYYPSIQTPRVMGIESGLKALPKSKHMACFDTGFHSTLPDYAYRYALPEEVYTNYGIRKYGFHGLTHKYVCNEALTNIAPNLKIISIFLSTGASVAAVKSGVCLDTSMGITPLEGLVMGTRSGDIDVSVIRLLQEMGKMSTEEVFDIIGKKSGVLGVSEVGSSISEVNKLIETNPKCKLAMQMYAYRIKKYIGAYITVLGGCDAIIFSGPVGETDPSIRARVLSDMECLGIQIDPALNEATIGGASTVISSANSMVKVLVIPANEELNIAEETKNILEDKSNIV